MITDISQLDTNKKYTYQDYISWNLQEQVELIKGYLFKMTPTPSSEHQKISMIIGSAFHQYLKNRKCEFYSAPFDVRFYDIEDPSREITNVVQPDISVICDLSKIDKKGCLGAPDLIVEILSPSTSEKDLTHKYELYRNHGVSEYWIITPIHKTVMVYTLDELREYKPSRLLTRGDIVHSSVLEGFTLDLSEVFEPFDWEAHEMEEKYYRRI